MKFANVTPASRSAVVVDDATEIVWSWGGPLDYAHAHNIGALTDPQIGREVSAHPRSTALVPVRDVFCVTHGPTEAKCVARVDGLPNDVPDGAVVLVSGRISGVDRLLRARVERRSDAHWHGFDGNVRILPSWGHVVAAFERVVQRCLEIEVSTDAYDRNGELMPMRLMVGQAHPCPHEMIDGLRLIRSDSKDELLTAEIEAMAAAVFAVVNEATP
jgi:hypothetical protein